MSLADSIKVIPVTGFNYGINPDSAKIFEQKINSLNLLLFSVGGVYFGIDSEQITEIAAYCDEAGEDLVWFHNKMGYGGKFVEYHSPTVLTIRMLDGVSRRVIIDSMEDIAEFSLNDINLLPSLLEPLVLSRGIWGVLVRNGRMVLLLDVKRMLLEKNNNSNEMK